MTPANELPQLLPIKVVLPSEGDYVPPDGGGGGFEPIDPVTPEVRQNLSDQAQLVNAELAGALRNWGLPGVAKVQLKEQAFAKTKRPSEILNDHTCPVIGCGQLGELLISVTPNGLEALDREIRSNETQKGVAHISTIERIEVCRPEIDVQPNLFKKNKRKSEPRLRCRLFRHKDQDVNEQIDEQFLEYAEECGVEEVIPLDYAEGLKMYALKGVDAAKSEKLSKFIGLQQLDHFPTYRVVRTTSHVRGPLTTNRFPPPDPDREYPVVGIIDSGTDPRNAELQKWVVGRKDWPLPKDQDNDHGTFVAGLIANGHALNHNDPRFPDAQCKIVDVAALDKNGSVTEDELLIIIDDALKTWPEVRVWNLSLGLDGVVCQDHEFSLLAAAIDQRMKDYNVLFVIAAGNYATPPFRSWPPQPELSDPNEEPDQDRISPPGDALCALTVGSVAHKDTPNTVVQENQPSPFTRRGPGAAYTLKPEVSFPGGNCDAAGDCTQAGVLSVHGQKSIAENIGTSFATPLASAVAAHVFRELEVTGQTPSATFVKGLIVHSAFVKNPVEDAEEVDYYGLKDTCDPHQIVMCTQSCATIVISAKANPKRVFGKRPFPVPPCLFDDLGLGSEIFLTLIYNPPLDRSFGVEYCRCNVTASLGTEKTSPTSEKPKYTRKVEPFPEKNALGGTENELVKHGYKWSPMKLYHHKFKKKSPSPNWRLTLETLYRAEHPGMPLDVTILITIRSRSGTEARVYDEMVQEMTRLNWVVQNLQLRSSPPRQRN
jgi:serine protease AprX